MIAVVMVADRSPFGAQTLSVAACGADSSNSRSMTHSCSVCLLQREAEKASMSSVVHLRLFKTCNKSKTDRFEHQTAKVVTQGEAYLGKGRTDRTWRICGSTMTAARSAGVLSALSKRQTILEKRRNSRMPFRNRSQLWLYLEGTSPCHQVIVRKFGRCDS